jgi:hypothetical protein
MSETAPSKVKDATYSTILTVKERNETEVWDNGIKGSMRADEGWKHEINYSSLNFNGLFHWCNYK